jgi:hypothetical protein
MSVNIDTWRVQQYASNIKMLLQQKGSRLRGKVMEGTHKGKQASPVDQVGAVEMQPVTTRFQPMGRVDAATARRWVQPLSFELPQLVDDFDLLKLISDPKSIYVENAVAAAGRQIDNIIIDAFFGTAVTGETASGSTVFDTNYSVAADFGASAEVGLTVAKLREGRRLLMANEVDLETDPIYCAVTARQHDNLLAEAQVISTDFNDRPVLVEGQLRRFLGINFVHTELLDLVNTDDRAVPLWAKSGMHLGIWGDIETSVSKRNDLSSEPWQVYVKLTCGATRLEEKKTIRLLCDE